MRPRKILTNIIPAAKSHKPFAEPEVITASMAVPIIFGIINPKTVTPIMERYAKSNRRLYGAVLLANLINTFIKVYVQGIKYKNSSTIIT